MDKQFFVRCIIILATALLSSSCSTTPETIEISQPEKIILPTPAPVEIKPSVEELNQAQTLQDNQQWQAAFTAWQEIAKVAPSEDAALYSNNSALMLYKLNQLEVIPEFYDSLAYSFEKISDINHKNILLSAAYFNQGKTYQSLTSLPDLNKQIGIDYLIIGLKTRAAAILNIGKPLDSAKIHLRINKLLTDQNSIEQNYADLWSALNRLSDSSILRLLKKPQESDIRGWLELSLIARRSNMIPAKLEPWISKWNEIYPLHDAKDFADNLLAQSKDIYINPTNIALMLPLDGKLAKVSNAILDGFLYAHYQSLKTSTEQNTPVPSIEVIPITSEETFKAQYDQSILNGADFVVGPLNKKSVELLNTQMNTNVPTLALNYSADETLLPNLFQFGLKPEDEANQVADYALLDQKYNAATLTPDTAWGERLNEAFKERYERLGGAIHSEARYPSKSNDYGLAIKNLLNLSQSNSRHSMIQTIIGEKAEFNPRRRQDLDMIFIGANARQARIIKPQLKFHYAQDIQVYGTSHIANSNAKKSADRDRDLNGVYYVDMPWTLRSNQLNETKDIAKLWPTLNKSHGRLFALGIDAYRLIPHLKRLKLNPEEFHTGLTGNLKVDENGRIHRELLLATYLKGKQIEITESLTE